MVGSVHQDCGAGGADVATSFVDDGLDDLPHAFWVGVVEELLYFVPVGAICHKVPGDRSREQCTVREKREN